MYIYPFVKHWTCSLVEVHPNLPCVLVVEVERSVRAGTDEGRVSVLYLDTRPSVI